MIHPFVHGFVSGHLCASVTLSLRTQYIKQVLPNSNFTRQLFMMGEGIKLILGERPGFKLTFFPLGLSIEFGHWVKDPDQLYHSACETFIGTTQRPIFVESLKNHSRDVFNKWRKLIDPINCVKGQCQFRYSAYETLSADYVLQIFLNLFSNITMSCKLHMKRVETLINWGQRPMSNLLLYLWNLVGTIKTRGLSRECILRIPSLS